MARRGFGGAEFFRPSLAAVTEDELEYNTQQDAESLAGAARSGRAGIVLTPSTSVTVGPRYEANIPAGTARYIRAYPKFSSLTPNGAFMQLISTFGSLAEARYTAAGKVQLWVNNAKVGSDSAFTVQAGVRFRAELGCRRNAGSNDDWAELRVAADADIGAGETVASTSTANLPTTGTTPCIANLLAPSAAEWDDWALNDSSVPAGFTAGDPFAQDSFPGEGRAYLLDPLADVAVGSGWGSPAWSVLDNRPPTASQVLNDSALTALDVEVETLASKGAIGATVACAMAVMIGSAENVSVTGAIAGVSNPAIPEKQYAAFPASSEAVRGTDVLHLPSIDGSTRPVIRIARRAGTAGHELRARAAGLAIEMSPISSGNPVRALIP